MMSECNEPPGGNFGPTLDKSPAFKAFIGICLGIFAGYELYKWYSVGQLDFCGTFQGRDGFAGCRVITHASAPGKFDFVATIDIAGVVVGLGAILMLYRMVTNRK